MRKILENIIINWFDIILFFLVIGVLAGVFGALIRFILVGLN